MGKKLKTENNIEYFAETSAKTGFNAKEIFKEAAKLLYEDHLKYKEQLDRRVYLYFIQRASSAIVGSSKKQLNDDSKDDNVSKLLLDKEGKKKMKDRNENDKSSSCKC